MEPSVGEFDSDRVPVVFVKVEVGLGNTVTRNRIRIHPGRFFWHLAGYDNEDSSVGDGDVGDLIGTINYVSTASHALQFDAGRKHKSPDSPRGCVSIRSRCGVSHDVPSANGGRAGDAAAGGVEVQTGHGAIEAVGHGAGGTARFRQRHRVNGGSGFEEEIRRQRQTREAEHGVRVNGFAQSIGDKQPPVGIGDAGRVSIVGVKIEVGLRDPQSRNRVCIDPGVGIVDDEEPPVGIGDALGVFISVS